MATNLELMTPLEELSKEIFGQNLQVLAQTDEYQRTLVGKPILGLGFKASVVKHSDTWDAEPVDPTEGTAPAETRTLYVTDAGTYQPFKATTKSAKEIAKMDRTIDLEHLMAKTLLDGPGKASQDIDSEAFRVAVTGAKDRAAELDSQYNSKNKLETLMRVATQAVENSCIWVPYYTVRRINHERTDSPVISGTESFSYLKAYLANAPKALEVRQSRLDRLVRLGAPKEIVEQAQERVDTITRQVQKAKETKDNRIESYLDGKGLSQIEPSVLRYF